MAKGRRIGLAFTSWFKVSEQGMTSYEIMSRASAILVKQQSTTRHAIFTSQHVTHPFLWQQYYPSEQYDWLQFVNQSHMRYHLEVRDLENGKLYASFPSVIKAIHQQRDMSLLTLQDEDQFKQFVDSGEWESGRMQDLVLDLYDRQLERDQSVSFQGFELVQDQTANSDTEVTILEEEEQPLLPKQVSGLVNLHDISNDRIFVKTLNDRFVSMGMCGGPCVTVNGEKQQQCVGILEGLVQKVNHESMEHLQNNAVIIPSVTMIEFMKSVHFEKSDDMY